MLQRAKLIARVAQEAGLSPAQLNAKLEQPSMLRRTPAWVFLGPPGVGKGTYASRVADALGLAHIAAGDLVREEIKQQTDLGQQVCGCMSSLLAYHLNVTRLFSALRVACIHRPLESVITSTNNTWGHDVSAQCARKRSLDMLQYAFQHTATAIVIRSCTSQPSGVILANAVMQNISLNAVTLKEPWIVGSENAVAW